MFPEASENCDLRCYLNSLLKHDSMLDLPLKIGKFYEGEQAYAELNNEIKRYVATYTKYVDNDPIFRESERIVAEDVLRHSFFNYTTILNRYTDFVERRF